MKFGGTSVANIERIQNVARHVKREVDAGNKVAVVVSAMSGVTNQLVAWVKEVSPLYDAREYDAVVATGEQVTAGLLALALQALGVKARSWTGWQVPIKTNAAHGAARIADIPGSDLKKQIDSGEVAVVTGFQGIEPKSDRVSTLGRGGSDTSAVAIAVALEADFCDIYTDVDGVYTTDPRIVPSARKLARITFEEMLELAGSGAKVLQVRSVGLAMREKMPLRVLTAFEDRPGTEIVAELGNDMERNEIAGIAADRNEARVTLTGILDRPGMVSAVIGPLAAAGVQVDMMVHSATEGVGESDLTFTVPRASVAQTVAVLEPMKDSLGYARLLTNAHVAKVSIVGVGIRSNPNLAATMFATLAERRINLLAVSASEIKVSVLIAEDEMELAVRVLHSAFGLDAEKGEVA
jgi:aspartate kinase